MVLFGEIVRKIGMITAKKAFTHLIQDTKRESHHLVTEGIYSICRHPGRNLSDFSFHINCISFDPFQAIVDGSSGRLECKLSSPILYVWFFLPSSLGISSGAD